MPDDQPWTQGLPPELAAVAQQEKWTSPADAIAAYQRRAATSTDPWEGLEPEVLTALRGKKFEKPGDVARSWFAAQKFVGKPQDELAHIPKEGLTPEMKRELAKRVFRTPEKPEEYDFGDLKDEEGAPPMLGWFRGLAHELGLGQEEAKLAAERYGKFAEEQQATYEARMTEVRAAAQESLTKKHGKEYDALRQAGGRALAALGITDPKSPGPSELELILEQALGPEAFFETFASLGKRLGEHRITEGGGENAGVESLQAEFGQIMGSEAYHSKTHPGHAAAVSRAEAIMKKLHGDGPAYAE
jgi:hypothetical protein